MRASTGAVVVLSLAATGCWAGVESSVVRNETPDPRGHVKQVDERDQLVEVEIAYSESAVQVLAEDRTKCRDVAMRPYVVTEHTERKLTPTGQLVQYTNVGGALLLGLVGGILAAGYCKPSNSSTSSGSSGSAGNAGSSSIDQQQECTPDEVKSGRNAGYVTLGLAAIPTAFFVINALRARDSENTLPAPSRPEPREWKTCTARPLADQPITIVLKDGTRFADRTRENGRAVIDLSAADGLAAVKQPEADVLVAGTVRGTADLQKLGLYTQWQSAATAAAQERAREQQAERAAQMARCIPECLAEYAHCQAQAHSIGVGDDNLFILCGSEPGMARGRCQQACSDNSNYQNGSIVPKVKVR